MRCALLLPIAICGVAFALPANAVMKLDPGEVGVGRPIIMIAHHCPPGMGWAPAGYQRKGRWRSGHCSSWVTQRGQAPSAGNMADRLNAQERARTGSSAPGPYGGPAGPYGQPNQLYGIPGAGQPSAGTPRP